MVLVCVLEWTVCQCAVVHKLIQYVAGCTARMSAQSCTRCQSASSRQKASHGMHLATLPFLRISVMGPNLPSAIATNELIT